MVDVRHTIKYRHDNWTDKESLLTTGVREFWSSCGLNGSYHVIDSEHESVKIEDSGEEIADYIVYNDGSDWYCYDDGIGRMSSNPIVSALQVIHNLY